MKRRRPLGQNFLCDPSIADEIINLANIEENGNVLEIGPGKGILTGRILDRSKSLLALEIDPRLCQELKKKFGKNPAFNLVHQDALKFDYSSNGHGYQVISNLPYYAATPILKRLIEFKSYIKNMTLMFQKEVVDRLTAQPCTREYGSLTVFTQFHCEVQRLLNVEKDAFSPPPKINSAVIKVTPRPTAPVSVNHLKTFFQLVHSAFLHKRKTLKNNLKTMNKHYKLDLNKIEREGIDLSRRGETLTLQDFANLSNLIAQNHDEPQ